MRSSRSVGVVALGPLHRAGDDLRHDLGDLADDVGVLDRGRAERADHRRGDVGMAPQRPVRTGEHREHAVGRPGSAGGCVSRYDAQVGLLLGHRLEQQPLLRGEVAVDGAERDIGGRRRRRASAPRRSRRRRPERSVASRTRRRRAAWLLASAPGSSAVDTMQKWNTFRFPSQRRVGHQARAMDLLETADRLFTGELPIESHHPFTVERATRRDSARPRRSSTRSPTRRRSTPTTGSSSSTRAACSRPSRCTRRCGGGPGAGSTPRSSPTATSTTCSASSSTKPKRATNGWAPPRVVAHELVPERFDRYKLTAGYNAVINQRQFKAPGLRWPTRLPLPGRDVPPRPGARSRRRTLRAAPRARRDRRRHVGVGTRPQGRVRGRPVHLGVAELRQPAEGAALRARLGRGVPRDGGAATRCAAARPRTADHRRRPRAPSARRRCRAAGDVARPDARDDERGRAPRRHRARRARAGASRSRVRTSGRSTTSPSSSCATSGATTAAGTTATRRTSSPRLRLRSREELADARRWRAPPRRSRDGARGRAAISGSRATSPSSRRRPRRTTKRCTRCAPRSSAHARREEASTMSKGIFSWAEHESTERTK